MRGKDLFLEIRNKLQDVGLLIADEIPGDIHLLYEMAGPESILCTPYVTEELPQSAIRQVLEPYKKFGLIAENPTPSTLKVTFHPYRCQVCSGTGVRVYFSEEDGREDDPCYTCGTSGRISTYRYVLERLNKAVNQLVANAVDSRYEFVADDVSDNMAKIQGMEALTHYLNTVFSSLDSLTVQILLATLAPDTETVWNTEPETPTNPMILKLPSEKEELPF